MAERFFFVMFFALLIGCSGTSIESSSILYVPLSNEIILHGRYYVQGSNVMYDWSCFKIDFCF